MSKQRMMATGPLVKLCCATVSLTSRQITGHVEDMPKTATRVRFLRIDDCNSIEVVPF